MAAPIRAADAAIAAPSASASASICSRRAALGDRHQQAVARARGSRGRAGSRRRCRAPRSARAPRSTGASRRTANSRATGASCSSSTPVHRRQPLAGVGGAPDQQLAQLAEALRGRARRGGPSPPARSAPARCRCCGSPSRGGCAARGSAGRGRSRAARRRRRSRRRSARACGGSAPRSRRRSRRRGRRSRAGCRAAAPRRGRCRRRTRPAACRTPSVIGSTATTSSAPCSLAAAPSASTSSTAPRKFGLWRKTAAVSLVDRGGQRRGVGEAVLQPDLDRPRRRSRPRRWPGSRGCAGGRRGRRRSGGARSPPIAR